MRYDSPALAAVKRLTRVKSSNDQVVTLRRVGMAYNSALHFSREAGMQSIQPTKYHSYRGALVYCNSGIHLS
jgi:hypothetical protein